jgi:hypothetical protein
MHFSPLFKEKKPQIHKSYINKVDVKLNCASNNKRISFYIHKYIEQYMIKG